nr:PAS domain S-box protein [uncultured Rhodopila sp.]
MIGLPRLDAHGTTIPGGSVAAPPVSPSGRRPDISWPRRGRAALSLRARLLLLVVASVVPLVCMGVFREYWDYRVEREQVYERLRTIARGMAVAVERELQLRVSALETLATSPALQADDLTQFDRQAEAFLARQPPGAVLGLSAADAFRVRMYGLPPDARPPLSHRDPTAAGTEVFTTGRPLVTNLHIGHATGLAGFSVDVPVFRDGKVAYDLFLRLLPRDMAELIARQHLPPQTIMTIVDGAGAVIARVPNADRFIGSHIVPGLWEAAQSRPEGVATVPTLEGAPAVAAFTRVDPFGWSVVVGAPEEVLFAPTRAAMAHVAEAGLLVLAAGLVLATFAARQVTRPIERLRRLAAGGDPADRRAAEPTGLPETDMVADALMAAAAHRQEAARALAESEQRFRAVFERSSSGAILLDPDTTQIIDCNEAAASFVGCTAEEFRQCRITDFRLETTEERIHEICRSVVAGQTLRYEARVKGRQGPRDLLVAVGPLVVGGRTLVLLNQIDVTDLRKAEAGLRINEERLELARQGAKLGIWDWDVIAGTLTWSDHNWFLHGLEPRPDGPTSAEWRQTLDPADRPRVVEELYSAVDTPGVQFATEYNVVLPDRSFRRLLSRGQIIRDPRGHAVRVVGINMDVTARYEAERARDRLIHMLETERSRLADIIEALPVGVGIVDRSGWLTLGNPIMQALTGPVIPSMDNGRADQWIAHHPDGSRVAAEDFPIERALRGETVLPGEEFLHRAADGTETWITVGSLPLRRENGEVQEVLAILQDVDAEKRLKDVQQETNVRLEQRVREEMAAREAAQQRAAHAERLQALGQIAGGIAHDFNNVLQAVAGGAALIERRPNDNDRVLRNARMVADAARRGAAITSRLLAFARRGDLRAESLDAAGLLRDMGEVLTHTLGGSVVCKVDVAPNLPPLFADRGQLETVLVNLATNARDAMPLGGTLTLSAEAEEVSTAVPNLNGLPPGGYVRIVVADTGSGMDRTVLARVTEPFFTTKETGRGTGLGLAMAKGFVEQSGGGLSIDSTVGQGPSVTFWLPQAKAAPAPESAAAELADNDRGGSRVLLVDDDALVRDVLGASLEDAGYTVQRVSSGPAALARLAAGDRVDVMVSDLTMPGMDGLALIRMAQQQRPGLPAVLLTGYAGDGAALAIGGALSGSFSLLRKPVSGTQLADRIHALLASGNVAAGA